MSRTPRPLTAVIPATPASRAADRPEPRSGPLRLPASRRAWSEWPFVVPFAGRVLALQGMHPVVSAGMMDHSSVFRDPWGRGWDTIGYGLRLVFSDDPLAVAGEIRELHRPLHGRLADGTRYHPWNPGPWAWVHLSTFEATVYARRAIGRAPTPAEQAELYEEWKRVGRGYGLREQDLPADVAALNRYVWSTIQDELVATPTATRLYHDTLRSPPAPPGLPGAQLAWPLAGRLAGPSIRLLLAGSFPSVLRRRMSIPWTPLHEAGYQAALLALRAAVHTLPAALTRFPIARAAA